MVADFGHRQSPSTTRSVAEASRVEPWLMIQARPAHRGVGVATALIAPRSGSQTYRYLALDAYRVPAQTPRAFLPRLRACPAGRYEMLSRQRPLTCAPEIPAGRSAAGKFLPLTIVPQSDRRPIMLQHQRDHARQRRELQHRGHARHQGATRTTGARPSIQRQGRCAGRRAENYDESNASSRGVAPCRDR